jgi:precorrin-2 dehydrogenase / sirohydrochlorin ferrochelatase
MRRKAVFHTGLKGKAMSLFPMFVKLEGRRCLVVGAGKVGEGKVRSLLVSRARVKVVAPSATPQVAAWAQVGLIEWEGREFAGSDLEGMFLVVAATSLVAVNTEVHREAQARGILCNAVDDPERCDFYYGSVVRRGQLQVAISTEGQSPALAQRLRRDIEAQIDPSYAGWLVELGKQRAELRRQPIDPEARRRRLHNLASDRAFRGRSANTARRKGTA